MIRCRGSVLRTPTLQSQGNIKRSKVSLGLFDRQKEIGDMRQKVEVRGFIQVDNRVLLLRRCTGKQYLVGKYELPGDEIRIHEQPEDTLKRVAKEELGIDLYDVRLFDVVTYIDRTRDDDQFIVIAYRARTRTNNVQLLHPLHDKSVWVSLTNNQQESLTGVTELMVGLLYQGLLTDGIAREVSGLDDNNTAVSYDAVIYSDGGSRGNPGPSAAGFVVLDPRTEAVEDEGGEYLGITTNNLAEYYGVVLGLERAKAMGRQRIDFRVDSSLIVNQMNGIYTIKNRELWPVHERVCELVKQFDKVTFTHVKRELNQLADGVVNKILNQQR